MSPFSLCILPCELREYLFSLLINALMMADAYVETKFLKWCEKISYVVPWHYFKTLLVVLSILSISLQYHFSFVIYLCAVVIHFVCQLVTGDGTVWALIAELWKKTAIMVSQGSKELFSMFTMIPTCNVTRIFCRRTITGGYTSSPRSPHKIHLSTINAETTGSG